MAPDVKSPQFNATVSELGGTRHSKPKLYDPVLTRSFAFTRTTYVPVSGSVYTCCPFESIRPFTCTPAGENRVARASGVAPKPPVSAKVSVITCPASLVKLYKSTSASASIEPELRAPQISLFPLGSGSVVITTVTGTLSSSPSLTINSTTYVPSSSGVNIGMDGSSTFNSAVLVFGLLVKAHLNVNGSPSESKDLLPSNFTGSPIFTLD